MSSTVTKWREIVGDCVEETDVEWAEENAVEAENVDFLWDFYNQLPWSVQRCVKLGFKRNEDLRVQLEFDHNLLHWEEKEQRDELVRVEFHRKLTENEERAIRAQYKKEGLVLRDTDKFVGMTDQREFVIETEDWFRSLLVPTCEYIKGSVKYIRQVDEDRYAIAIEASSINNLIQDRFKQLADMYFIDCPECGERALKHVQACVACGIAINPDPVSVAAEELAPDASWATFNQFVTEWAKEIFEASYFINIRSELEFIGSATDLDIYENSGRHNRSGGVEFWVELEEGPVLFYSLNDGFLVDHQNYSGCFLCDNAAKDVVKGAYYKEGVGFKFGTFNLCDSCKSPISSQLQTVIKNSDRAAEFVSEVI